MSGFFIAAYLFDFVRQGLGEHGHLTLPLLGVRLTTYRTLFLVSLVIEVALFPVLYFLREGAEATDEGLRITPRPARDPERGLWQSACRAVGGSVKESVRLFRELFGQTGVYRLLAVPDPDRLYQAGSDADVLRLSEVRHPRVGGWRADRPALGDQ